MLNQYNPPLKTDLVIKEKSTTTTHHPKQKNLDKKKNKQLNINFGK